MMIMSGIGGCGTGVGVGAGGWIGAWQWGASCRTMSVILAAGLPKFPSRFKAPAASACRGRLEAAGKRVKAHLVGARPSVLGLAQTH